MPPTAATRCTLATNLPSHLCYYPALPSLRPGLALQTRLVPPFCPTVAPRSLGFVMGGAARSKGRSSACAMRIATLSCGMPLRRLRTRLASQEGNQTKMSVTVKVDEALINGITIELGDKFLDYSVATQLKKLQALLSDGL